MRFLSVGILIVLCGAMGIYNYRIGGIPLVKDGIMGGAKFLLEIAPLIIVLALLSGQIGSLYSKKPEMIRSAVKGKMGVVKAAGLGALIPGGAAMGPILEKEWKNEDSKPAIIIFILAMTLVNWNTIVFRLPFFGESITAWIYGIGVGFIGVAVVAAILFQRFRT